MATLGSLVIELAGNVGRLQSDMQRAVSVVDSASGKMRAAATAAGRALAGIGAGLSVAGLAGFVRQGIEIADAMGKAAQRSGVTTEAFTKLNYAAELADVSTSSLETALGTLGRKAAEAARGSETSAKAFERIGVAVTNADGTLREVDQIFLDVADSLSRLPPGAQQTAAAMAVLGRGGRELLPVLAEGRAGLEAFAAEAERMGVVIKGDTARAADEFGDQLDKMRIAARGLSISVGTDLLPALTRIAEATRQAYEQSGALYAVLVAIGAIATAPFVEYAQGADALKNKAADLRKEIATLQDELATGLERQTGRGGRRPLTQGTGRGAVDEFAVKREQLKQYQAELARTIRAQLELLKPAKGNAPTAEVIVDEKAAEAARKASERLAESERDYIAGLEKRIALQKDSTELAGVLADIESGAAKEFSAATQERIKQLAAEYDLLQDTVEVREYLAGVERQRRQDAARATTQAAADRQRVIESLRTPEEAYAAEVRGLLSMNLDEGQLQRGIGKAIDNLEAARKKATETKTTFADLGATFESAFEQAIFAGEKFGDVLAGLGQDIARLLLRKTVTDPLAKLFSSGADAVLQPGGGIGGWLGKIFGGFRANGGPVSAGRAYVVGERGPELFIPGTAGTVAAGGGAPVINLIGAPAPASTSSRVANGRWNIDIMFTEAAGSAAGQGLLRPLGIAPPLVAR